MLKIDKPIIDEFLGKGVELKLDYVSRLKTTRMYAKGGALTDLILVLTPLMASDETFTNQLLQAQEMAGFPCKATRHKRGRNTVITLEPKSC